MVLARSRAYRPRGSDVGEEAGHRVPKPVWRSSTKRPVIGAPPLTGAFSRSTPIFGSAVTCRTTSLVLCSLFSPPLLSPLSYPFFRHHHPFSSPLISSPPAYPLAYPHLSSGLRASSSPLAVLLYSIPPSPYLPLPSCSPIPRMPNSSCCAIKAMYSSAHRF